MKFEVSFYNVIKTLTDTLGLINNSITKHHEIVTYVALKLGIKLDLSKDDLRKLVFSALLHDIGIPFFDEKIDNILKNRTYEEHAYVGYSLLKDSFPFDGYAEIIKNHHNGWEEIEHNQINYISNLLNLSDLIYYYISDTGHEKIFSENILSMDVENYCKGEISKEILDKAQNLFNKRSFWIDTSNIDIAEKTYEDYIFKHLDLYLNLDQVLEISQIVSQIIDFRNHFTATHSMGIATVSSKLAEDFSFSDEEVKIMEIAGYFHDIGKMIIPRKILNKKITLTKSEWGLMKTHTYYSYHVLDNIKALPNIKEWAAFHHETLDGKGYPFGIDKEKLSIGARILSVADIFTAISEDRPYRSGFEKEKVIEILKEEVDNKALDEEVVNKLINNYDKYNQLRNKKQEEAQVDYKRFKETTLDEIKDIYYE